MEIYISSQIDNRVKVERHSEEDKELVRKLMAKMKADREAPKTAKEKARLDRETRRWEKEQELRFSITLTTNSIALLVDKPEESMEVASIFEDVLSLVKRDKRKNDLVKLTKYVLKKYVVGRNNEITGNQPSGISRATGISS